MANGVCFLPGLQFHVASLRGLHLLKATSHDYSPSQLDLGCWSRVRHSVAGPSRTCLSGSLELSGWGKGVQALMLVIGDTAVDINLNAAKDIHNKAL